MYINQRYLLFSSFRSINLFGPLISHFKSNSLKSSIVQIDNQSYYSLRYNNEDNILMSEQKKKKNKKDTHGKVKRWNPDKTQKKRDNFGRQGIQLCYNLITAIKIHQHIK